MQEDIIARWSSSDLLDQISAMPEIPPMPTSQSENGTATNVDQKEVSQDDERTLTKPVPARTDDAAKAEQSTDQNQPAVAVVNLPSESSQNLAQPKAQAPHRKPEPPAPVSQPETTKLKPTIQSNSGDQVQEKPPLKTTAENRVKAPKMAFTGSPQAETVAESAAPVANSEAREETRKRRLQKRNEQRRKHRDRKAPASAESKGPNAVKRKLRVDTTDADPQELPPPDKSRNVAGGRIQSNSPKGGRRHRVDNGERIEQTLDTADNRLRTHSRPRQRYIDEPHGTSLRGPHFEVTAPRRSNLTSMTGQFLAYIGVLGLTVGTAMVIYGHFGGHSEYTPTGWLVTTVAQMMLFLGVINLVSGGMEQTNEDVSSRINHLGEQLLRIEQVTEEALRGPKIDPRRYADPDGYVEESQRETVDHGER